MNIKQQFKEGLITNNPVLVQLIGMCATMAITTSLFNGIGMGLSVLVILTCCNVVISLIRKVIPNDIRLAIFVLVIAGFVTIVDLLLQAYVPALSASLGVFIPLIVVNCIILGRAEMYASKHGVVDSAIDGAGMGLGFTLAICAMATIRETLGCGTFCGLPVPWFHENPIGILTMAPGGFFVFGCMIALINKISKGKAIKKKEFGCAGCPGCGKGACEGKEAAAK